MLLGWGSGRGASVRNSDDAGLSLPAMGDELSHIHAEEPGSGASARSPDDIDSSVPAIAEELSRMRPQELDGRVRRTAYLRDAAHQAGDERLAGALFMLGDALVSTEHESARAPLERALRQVAGP